jgi:hypothetical protein
MVAECFGRGDAPTAIVAMIETVELSGAPKRVSTIGKRGSRLADDWRPSACGIEYATTRGLDARRLETEIEKFKNYWTAKTGASSTKLDWEATWRNWILNTLERNNVPVRSTRANGTTSHTTARHSATGADAVIAGMGRIAARVVARRASGGKGGEDGTNSHGADAPAELDFERRGT